MKTIHITVGSYRTGAAIADAVMIYGLELARAGLMDVVDIPYLDEDGSARRVQFRIGWRVDTTVSYEDGDTEDLLELETLFALIDKAKTLQVPRRGHN